MVLHQSRLRKVGIFGVVMFMSLGGIVAPVSSVQMGQAVAYAAEQEAKITRQQAVAIAKQLISLPADAKQENIRFDQDLPTFQSAVWNLAQSGNLLRLYMWDDDREKGKGKDRQEFSQEAAEQTALAFLGKVAKNELQKLSKPNEFDQGDGFKYQDPSVHSFVYTRMENGIPFLENGFKISVDSSGKIIQFGTKGNSQSQRQR